MSAQELDIKIKHTELSIIVGVGFSDQYKKKYGARFMDVWNTSSFSRHPYSHCGFDRPLAVVHLVKQSLTINELIADSEFKNILSQSVLDIETDCRLASFYVFPLYASYDEHTGMIDLSVRKGHSLNDYMTHSERRLFKGLGAKILGDIVKTTNLKRMCLEASGGETSEDMRKLVGYYKSLGFKTLSDDEKYLVHCYDNYNTPMYADISSLKL